MPYVCNRDCLYLPFPKMQMQLDESNRLYGVCGSANSEREISIYSTICICFIIVSGSSTSVKARSAPCPSASSMEASKKRIAAASDAHPAKRQRYNDSATGQRNALPGLDDSDNEFDDDLTKEAVMYLRGVR